MLIFIKSIGILTYSFLFFIGLIAFLDILNQLENILDNLSKKYSLNLDSNFDSKLNILNKIIGDIKLIKFILPVLVFFQIVIFVFITNFSDK